jgi:transposase InsO family protein
LNFSLRSPCGPPDPLAPPCIRHRALWDNAAMESFFSSLKTERTARKMYRTRNEAKADVFDYIECFYNPKRRHSTIGYLSLRDTAQ